MKVKKYETNFKRNMRLSVSEVNFKESNKNHERDLINIYPEVEYQEIIGFGGAFTEAGGYALSETNESVYNSVISDYFSEAGLNYSLCRTHIGSCDFSLKTYTYIEKDNIDSFSIEHDKKYLIPFIKKALASNESLKLLASPWSPPSSFKDNKRFIIGGRLAHKYYDAYAMYLAKYIEAYKNENIDINYITVQNEASFAAPWESCIYDPENEIEFVNNHLFPTFNSNNINTKILAWDHNKEKIYNRAKKYFENNNHIDGVAFHWYSGDYFDEIAITKKEYPNSILIHTEGCTGYSKFNPNEEVKNAEIYGHDIIGDMNAGANGFIDWNMVLNYKGGPNHKFNYCNSPIMINKENDGYIKNLSYYYIGHFSKFVRPGAKRIGHSIFTNKIELTAFKNTDNSVIITLLNRNDYNIQYDLKLGNTIFHDNLDSHCIVTFVVES